jgi:hypothetical protein
MPLTHLLVAALAFSMLSLSPRESLAGPLQEASKRVPPDWLTRSEHPPRQTRQGMSCAGKILLGLGVGAGAGLGLIAYASGGVPFPREGLGVSLAFGSIGGATGYKMCR